ncbi:hypothetical protein MRX96_038220 [Rhipicephalus microplus]
MDFDRIKRKRAVVRTATTKLLNDIAAMEGDASQGKTSAVAKQLLRDIIQALRSPPLPKPVHQQVHQERRMARAMTLTKRHASDARTDHVDVAKYPHRPNTYTAAVNAADAGVLITSGSVRCKSPTQAEEFAIALAMAIPDRRTVLSDS